MIKTIALAVVGGLVASSSAYAWEEPTYVVSQIPQCQQAVQVQCATQVVKKPITTYVTKTRVVPHQEIRHGVKKVAKTIKVPKVIYVEKTVYEDVPYTYQVTVNKTETYRVPVTTYAEQVVTVPQYHTVVNKTKTYGVPVTTYAEEVVNAPHYGTVVNNHVVYETVTPTTAVVMTPGTHVTDYTAQSHMPKPSAVKVHNVTLANDW